MQGLERTFVATLAALLLTLLTGCGSAPAATESQDAASSRDVIGEAELGEMESLDALQALQRLKPAWLQGRGTGTFRMSGQEAVRVYLDRVPYGGPESLRSIPVRNIQEIRYLDSRRATLTFGTDHVGGAILITTRRGR